MTSHPLLVISVHTSLGLNLPSPLEFSKTIFLMCLPGLFLEVYIGILVLLLNLVTCRLDNYVQSSLFNEDSKLISMKHRELNFSYL